MKPDYMNSLHYETLRKAHEVLMSETLHATALKLCIHSHYKGVMTIKKLKLIEEIKKHPEHKNKIAELKRLLSEE